VKLPVVTTRGVELAYGAGEDGRDVREAARSRQLDRGRCRCLDRPNSLAKTAMRDALKRLRRADRRTQSEQSSQRLRASAKMSINKLPNCVVLDTNVWISQNLLRSPATSALLFSMIRAGSLLGLPEVIELEIKKQALRAARELRNDIAQHTRQLGLLLGTPARHILDEEDLPTDEQILGAIQTRISALETMIVRIPFTHEHAKRALKRVLDEIPPNNPKDQQFKDSAIWEAMLELAGERTVTFVSGDRAFFEGRDYKQGLATALEKECKERGAKVNADQLRLGEACQTPGS
jgi:hypothetical protein